VEQGYQQLKEELGLDHFEGRSWHGFHRHAVLVMMAYGFLTLERLRLQEQEAQPQQQPQQPQQQQQQQQEADGSAPTFPARRTKRRRDDNHEPCGPRLTLPAVRRALQRFLPPACHLDCPYCRALAHR
jgi:hypothetical protein